MNQIICIKSEDINYNLSKFQLQQALQRIGFKKDDTLVSTIYDLILKNSNEDRQIEYDVLVQELTKIIQKQEKIKKLKNLKLGFELISQKMYMIILLGGTSGSGKSSIASLLGNRLGISSVLSTDSIRHIMRNFVSDQENPLLFCSTYESGKFIVSDQLSQNKKTIKGFYEQAQIVQNKLVEIIESYVEKKQSIIIEGVHLTPDFMLQMFKKYKYVFPFTIIIQNEKKHMERFAVRSKSMTLVSSQNKYIKNFANIRVISKNFQKKSDEYLIPKINNSNIDKSIETIHKTVMRYLNKLKESRYFINNNQQLINALPLYEDFNKTIKSFWSSNAVKEYIEQKQSKINKHQIVQSFIKQIELTGNDRSLIENKQENQKSILQDISVNDVQDDQIQNIENKIKDSQDQEFLQEEEEKQKSINDSNDNQQDIQFSDHKIKKIFNNEENISATINLDNNSFKDAQNSNQSFYDILNIEPVNKAQRKLSQNDFQISVESDQKQNIKETQENNKIEFYNEDSNVNVKTSYKIFQKKNYFNIPKTKIYQRNHSLTKKSSSIINSFNKKQQIDSKKISLECNLIQIRNLQLILQYKNVSLSKDLKQDILKKINKIIHQINIKQNLNLQLYKTNSRYIIFKHNKENQLDVQKKNEIMLYLNYRERIMLKPLGNEFDESPNEDVSNLSQNSDYSFDNQKNFNNSISKNSSLEVNGTKVVDLNFTNEMLSVSDEDSLIIDEEDEYSDQTQSVDPSDQQSSQNSESDELN